MQTLPTNIFSLVAELHPAFHLNIGTANLIKTLSSYSMHRFSCIVATDHAGPAPVSGPWDNIPTLSLFRPRALFPKLQMGLGLLDPASFRLQQSRVKRFMESHNTRRQFVLIANNARFASFAAGLSTNIPRDVYIVDDFVADSHLYRVNRKKAQWVLDKLVNESDRVFTISPVYAADLEEQYGRRCEFLPIPIPDALLNMNGEKGEKQGNNENEPENEPIRIHHAGQIHHLYADALAKLVVLLRKIAEKRDVDIQLELWGNLKRENVEQGLKLNLKKFNEESQHRFKIKLCGEVPLEQLIWEQKHSDFLLLANSFLPELKKHIRCSLSSKISEYMLSGVPIIVYAPSYSSLAAHLGKHNAAYIVSDREPNAAMNRLEQVMFDPEGESTTEAARVLALTEHSGYAFFKRLTGTVRSGV
ncbi:MAG: glycosyltransferase family 4 protein [bacterium]|nr:glycosyltransferase family 4 protein [bacterium]